MSLLLLFKEPTISGTNSLYRTKKRNDKPQIPNGIADI